MIGRIVIDRVRPSTPAGYPAKATVGEVIPVSATLFADGHDALGARVKWRGVGGPDGKRGDGKWEESYLVDVGNDRWEASLACRNTGSHEIVIEAWRDRWATWCHGAEAKVAAELT